MPRVSGENSRLTVVYSGRVYRDIGTVHYKIRRLFILG